MSCLYFKILYPKARIKAFEADPIIADVLKLNLARNGINARRHTKKAFGCKQDKTAWLGTKD